MKRPESLPIDPSRLRVTDLIIGLLSLVWGTTYFVIQEGLSDLPPFTAVGVRFAIAGSIFALIAPAISRREGGRRPGLRISLVLGLGNFTIAYAIVYVVETKLPSGLVSVFWGTFPLMLATCVRIFLPDEVMSRRQWLGFSIGFLGIIILFLTDLREIGEDGMIFGALLLLSPLVTSFGQVYVKKHGGHVSSVQLNRNGLLIASIVLLAIAGMREGDARIVWSATAIGSVLYLAIVGTVVTFGLYYWALRHAPAHRLGVIAYLTPILALTIGTVFGQEPLSWHTLLGTALVLGSVGLVMRRGRRPTAMPASVARTSD
ncbi:MAG: EamA family transporter [Planctomycetota bacterium]